MKHLLPLLAFVACLADTTEPAAAEQPPNIVFLMTDDQRWDTMGCYGRSEFLTPNIDDLSRRGVTFDKAYYAVAICMPSRATMMTGRYFSDHNVGFAYPYDGTLSEQEFADSYPAQMKAAGYRTGFVGKFGFRVQDLDNSLSKHFDFLAINLTHIRGKGATKQFKPADDSELTNLFRKQRPRTDRTIKKGDAMIRFLDTQPKGQPFCLSVSFDAVKNDRDADMHPPHVELFKDTAMSVPENWVEGKNHRLPKVLDHWRGTSLHVARSSRPEQYQRNVRRFAAQGYTVDQQVGRLVAKLEEMRVLDNTVIIYTSDNGRFHGSHGLFDKAILYEESMRAPLIVFDGRASADSHRGCREDALVSSADMAPTMLAMAGLDPPASMKGHSITGLLDGTQDRSQWRDAVFMESGFLQSLYKPTMKAINGNEQVDLEGINQRIIAENKSYRCRGVRTDRWKYFKYYEHTPVIEELYDLEADPHEQHNLAADPTHADTLAELRAKTEALYARVTE